MERDAFEKLALRHLDAVYRLALSLSRNQERAEDLVQDVYARAFRPNAVARFEERPDAHEDGTGGMRSWLFTICHNVFYTKVKRDAKAPVAVGEFYSDAADGPPPDEAPPAWDRQTLDCRFWSPELLLY